MQTINLKLPDGSTHALNFPDEMSDEQIQSAIHKEYGAPKMDTSSLLPENATSFGSRIPPNILAGLGQAAQNIANVPRRTAEFAEKHAPSKGTLAAQLGIKSSDIPEGKTDFAKLLKLPNTPEDEMTRSIAGFLPGLAIPEANLGKVGALIEKTPKVGRLLSKMLSNAAPQAAFAATQSEEPGAAASNAAEATLPFSALSTVATSTSPLVKLMGRLGLGGIGAYGGHLAAENVAPESPLANEMAMGGGALLGLLGASPSLENKQKVFKGVDLEKAKEKLAASRRLGLTHLTPAEASGNPFAGATQGNLGKTGEGSQFLYEKGEERLASEKNAINDLYKTIFDKEKLSPEVKSLYAKSYQKSVPEEELIKLRQNEIFKQAEKNVLRSPSYRESLKGVPQNSIGYLDRVKQSLDDMIEKAPDKESRLIKSAKNDLLNKMDTISPEYPQARALSEREITRRNIEDKLNDKEEKGTSFYSKILKNDKNFNSLIHSLRNVPEAQQKLHDMRQVFGDLINPPSVRTAAGFNKAGMNQNRNSAKPFIEFIKHRMANEKYDKAAVELITDPQWDSKFDEIMKIKSPGKRAGEVFNLLGRISAMTSAANTSKQGEQ